MKTLQTHLRLDKKQYQKILQLCLHSRALYNTALYEIRQYFFETEEYLSYTTINGILKSNIHYQELGAAIAQQTLRQVDKDFRSFFALLKRKRKGQYHNKISPPYYKKDSEYWNLIKPVLSHETRIKNDTLTIFNWLKIPFSYNVKGQIKQLVIKPYYDGQYLKLFIVYDETKNKKQEETKNYELNQDKYLSIDIGLNNLAACVDITTGHSFILNGKPLKSYNSWYNQRKAELQSILRKENNNQYWSQQLSKLTWDRSHWINNYMNQSIAIIIKYCINNNIGNIVMGYNKQWKNKINIGKKNNRNFVMVSFAQFKRKLKHKCESMGIEPIFVNESHTSKCDAFAKESVQHHEEYVGKRKKRGLFQSSADILVNADINGAINIARKASVLSNDHIDDLRNNGQATCPVLLHPLRSTDAGAQSSL